MAHLLAPQPPNPELPVFFNVDHAVGAAPAQNLREDVLLVQFAFKVMGEVPRRPNTEPELVAAARRVRVTGSIDAETVEAIKVFQGVLRRKFPDQVVDGRVSPARGGYLYSQSAAWLITHLNNALQNPNVGIWPRIDMVQGCPPELGRMVARTVAGV